MGSGIPNDERKPVVNRMIISVEGLENLDCVQNIEFSLMKMKGIERAVVDLERESARIEYDPHIVSHDKIRTTILEAGYGVREL